jgi:virulence factor Mce-like protein
VLVVLLAVFLSYNANSGLPFVPTYQVTAYVHDADKLAHNADVRIGGKRVGLVSTIKPEVRSDGTPVAALHLKLDQQVGPLPSDSLVRVRPRSVIGLKYLQLTPGKSQKTIPNGGTLPLRNARSNVDIQQALNAFDKSTRQAIRGVTASLGQGLAGRGAALNDAIRALNPLFKHLAPVAANLASPATDLDGFLRGLDSASRALAPVAPQLVGLFDRAAVTLRSVYSVDHAFGQVIEQTPETERVATDALRAVRPVLLDAGRLTVELRPGVAALPHASRVLADALEVGTPVLGRADALADRLAVTLHSLHGLVRDPATDASVQELRRLFGELVPMLRFLNPVQVRCNYLGTYFRNAASTVSEGDQNGNWFRFMPLLLSPDMLYKGKVSNDLHFDPYPSTGQDGHCVAGNERFTPGTTVGPPPNAASSPGHTITTRPPQGASG